ncbi:MAG: peptide deformylase [Anaerolineaceae bacterium]|nr:peptide deformylase [Chloroflexota bacterium]MCY4009622.1 peptide deformylase [Anaerolineaceae bacterium]
MALREIVLNGQPILRRRAIKLQDFGRSTNALIDDMLETMTAASGVGLAAPQVGERYRLFVARLPEEADEAMIEKMGDARGQTFVFANPKIIKRSRETVEDVEGCLSIPGISGTVERHQEIVVTGQDRNGAPQRVKAKGWLARVFQHEIDHLDGRLFIDIATRIWEDEAPAEENPADPAAAD